MKAITFFTASLTVLRSCCRGQGERERERASQRIAKGSCRSSSGSCCSSNNRSKQPRKRCRHKLTLSRRLRSAISLRWLPLKYELPFFLLDIALRMKLSSASHAEKKRQAMQPRPRAHRAQQLECCSRGSPPGNLHPSTEFLFLVFVGKRSRVLV